MRATLPRSFGRPSGGAAQGVNNHMQIGKRAAVAGALLAFGAMPTSAMAAKKKAKITVKSVAANQIVTIQQGAGVVERTPFSAKR